MRFENFEKAKAIVSDITDIQVKEAEVAELNFQEPGANNLSISDGDHCSIRIPKRIVGSDMAKHIQDEVLQALDKKKESLLAELEKL